MVAPFRFEGRRIDAETIRDELGTFSDTLRRQPARYAARVAQALSATSVSITIPPSSIVRMLDIETDGHVFTDGVSSISPDMAAAISKGLQCGRGRANQGPLDSSAFQFRLGDAKVCSCTEAALTLSGDGRRRHEPGRHDDDPAAEPDQVRVAHDGL